MESYICFLFFFSTESSSDNLKLDYYSMISKFYMNMLAPFYFPLLIFELDFGICFLNLINSTSQFTYELKLSADLPLKAFCKLA